MHGVCIIGSHVYFLWSLRGLLSFELAALYQFLLQNHQTPVHLAAHLGHVEVLRVLIKGYHADKMVKAMVNECQTYSVLKVCASTVHICISYFSVSARMVGRPSTMLLMVVTLRQ